MPGRFTSSLCRLFCLEGMIEGESIWSDAPLDLSPTCAGQDSALIQFPEKQARGGPKKKNRSFATGTPGAAMHRAADEVVLRSERPMLALRLIRLKRGAVMAAERDSDRVERVCGVPNQETATVYPSAARCKW